MEDEQGLWIQFLKGSEKALADIFLQHHDDLIRYGLKLTKSTPMMEDCIQDLFFKLWKNRANLQVVRIVKPYLFRSLRNHLVDSLELQKQRITQDLDEETVYHFDLTYHAKDFFSEDSDDENLDRVIDALNLLTPRQREVVYLRFFENLDFEAIAKVMEMNVQSVRNVLHRGLLTMRKASLLVALLCYVL